MASVSSSTATSDSASESSSNQSTSQMTPLFQVFLPTRTFYLYTISLFIYLFECVDFFTESLICASFVTWGFARDENGVSDAVEEKPPSVDPFEDMDTKEYTDKFRKLEADYASRLMAKYFSDKDVYGGNIFEQSVTVGGETIKASRFHCAQSYADPMQFLKDKQQAMSSAQAANKEATSSTPPVNDNNNEKDAS